MRRPLTLISAPAGYGKSTIATQWLQTSALPGVWFALDESDNHLRTFLCYFVAAVCQHAPQGCRDTHDLLVAVDLPFPAEDPLYGFQPTAKSPEVHLGDLALRGEGGVLQISASALLRLRSNPFYPYVEERVLEFLALEKP